MAARIRYAAVATLFGMIPLFAATPLVGAQVLASESVALPSGANNAAAAPYMDMLVDTSPLTTWSEKGAVGLQGAGSTNINDDAPPASTVAFKFNVGTVVDALNTQYGAGNWTASNVKLTFQFTYYANNTIFGGGAGTFETDWVANDNWAFGAGTPTGNQWSSDTDVAGADPAYATTSTALATWAGSLAPLASTTYNWISPEDNPNYSNWTTAKSGANQGTLTISLASAAAFIADINDATTASNPDVSLYLIPTSSTLGLTIFTGGGSTTPTLTFDAVATPEPATIGILSLGACLLLRRRR